MVLLFLKLSLSNFINSLLFFQSAAASTTTEAHLLQLWPAGALLQGVSPEGTGYRNTSTSSLYTCSQGYDCQPWPAEPRLG